MVQKYLLLLLGTLFFFSCKKDHYQAPVVPLTDTVFHDVAYGGIAAQMMDIHLASGRTKDTRLIVLIHGGGWSGGDKSELNFLAEGLKARGFAVANINYRLSPQSNDNYKMQLSDIEEAINYLQSKASYYGYDAGRLYITGHSAGAHLSLAYAYTRNSDGRIKAAAGMATPTDLVAAATANFGLLDYTTISPYLGGPLSPATQPKYEAASPFYQASATVPPTLLFQGSADFIVPPAQATSLRDKLEGLGVPVKLVMYNGAGHDWWGDPTRVNNTLDETAAWFQKY